MKKDRVLLGAHISIAGGVDKALLRGSKIGCSTIQIFTKNNNRWKANPLLKDNIKRFIALSEKTKINRIFAHTSYLINLSSPNKTMFRKSYKSFFEEIERCEILQIPYIVVHPGSTLGKSLEAGIDTISEAFNKILSEKKDTDVMICIETTAGQGSSIGFRFEHIAEILEKTDNRIGVCIDTCHIFAAGYDFRDKKSYNKTFKKFNEIIGFKNLKVIHINDSKRELGSRIDRHEHIGEGYIGIKAFELLMNDAKLRGIPKILETPKGPDMKEDIVNMNKLIGLIK